MLYRGGVPHMVEFFYFSLNFFDDNFDDNFDAVWRNLTNFDEFCRNLQNLLRNQNKINKKIYY